MDRRNGGKRCGPDPLIARIHETGQEIREGLDRILSTIDGVEDVPDSEHARYLGILLGLRSSLRAVRSPCLRATSTSRGPSTSPPLRDDKVPSSSRAD